MAAALRSIILFSHDLASAASFYRDVTSFRSIVPNVFVNGSGLCDVIIKPSSFPEAPALRSPYLTVAVSNLSSSKRKVSGRGGSLLDVTSSDDWGTRAGVPFPPSAHSWAVACDPSGVASLLLHKFRRNSIISITMACADVDVASVYYRTCFGLDPLLGPRIRECVNTDDNAPQLVLTPAASSPLTAVWAGQPPVVQIEVKDVSTARSAVLAFNNGDEGSVIDESGASFLTVDPDGHFLQVTRLPQHE